MEKGNIKTSFLETNYDKKTSTSFILINQQNHTRTIFNVQPEEFHLKKYEYDIFFIKIRWHIILCLLIFFFKKEAFWGIVLQPDVCFVYIDFCIS